MSNYTDPASHGSAITPHDTNTLGVTTRGIYVGGAGNIALQLESGDDITLMAVPAGTLLPIRARMVYDSDTTATLMIALW